MSLKEQNIFILEENLEKVVGGVTSEIPLRAIIPTEGEVQLSAEESRELLKFFGPSSIINKMLYPDKLVLSIREVMEIKMSHRFSLLTYVDYTVDGTPSDVCKGICYYHRPHECDYKYVSEFVQPKPSGSHDFAYQSWLSLISDKYDILVSALIKMEKLCPCYILPEQEKDQH